MCEYCKNIETGDDYFPIISLKQSFGFFGNVDVDVYLARDHTPDNPLMILGMCQDKGGGNAEAITEINFCPMCGRDLKVKQVNSFIDNLAYEFARDTFEVCRFMKAGETRVSRSGRLKLSIYRNPESGFENYFDIVTIDTTDNKPVDDAMGIYFDNLEDEIYKIVTETKEFKLID